MFLICLVAGIASAQVGDPGLSVSKAVYEQKVQAADQELLTRRTDLDSWYVSTLKTLLKSNQEKGELEPLLAIKGEYERFTKAKSVTGDDVVLFPAELTDTQRRYVTTSENITRDRKLKTARGAKSYLDDLESAKRSLTRIGEIDTAVSVNEEIKRIKESVDLSVLEEREAKAAPAPARTQPALPTAEVLVNPPGLRPLRDDIWVSALLNSFPVKDLKFTFIPSGAGKTEERQTDQMGRISFRTEPGLRYQILLVSDKYQFQQVRDATAGNTYQFKVGEQRAGSGVVYVKEKERQFELPGVGQVNVQPWANADGKSGPMFYTQRPVFRVARPNARNLNSSVAARFGEPFFIVDGAKQYEVTVERAGPGDAMAVHYRTVETSP